MDFSIAQIAKACGGQLFLNTVSEDFQVSGVVLDSRLVTEGAVFVATVGERVDGHSFIPQVCEKGACLVVCERSPEALTEQVNVPEGCNYLVVENSFQALKDIAESYRHTLSIPIVGITGSVGKTSTKEFVAGVLAEKYNVLKTEGNYNNEVGVPLTLLRIRKEHTAAVVEMGISDFGEMHRLSKMVRPNICLITNIGQCHLENLKTRDGILKAKTEIFDFMAPDGAVVLNGEDDKLSTLERVKDNTIVPYFFGLGHNEKESVYAENIVSKGLWGSEAVIQMRFDDTQAVKVNVPLPGHHMVINSAAAATVGRLLGLDSAQIAAGISKIQPTSGRGRLVRLSNATLIDDCYNANPVSMKAAIDLLMMADNRTVAILGDMFELGEDSDKMHGEVGAYAAKSGVNEMIFVGENALHMYEAAARETTSQKLSYYADRAEFIKALPKMSKLKENCTVLLKASHGMHFEEALSILEKEN